jgi:hypothetical protein
MKELSDAIEYLLSRVEGDTLVRPADFYEQIKFASAIVTVTKNNVNTLYFLTELEDLQRSH